MKKWILQKKLEIKNEKLEIEDLINLLLSNRGIKTQKEKEEYLNPSLINFNAKNLGINDGELRKTIARLNQAIKKREKIIIFGDYDVDGITGSAILWESLDSLSADVLPYIPHRVDEGYGLSVKGVENVISKYPDTKLILTVDNGIVANEAVDFANSKGLEVIITDHHVASEKLPNSYSIVHSTKICGAGVGWFLAQQLGKLNLKYDDHLGLVALATITDVMPLEKFNRILVKLGLEFLRKTKRPGIIELLKLAGIEQKTIGVYELGHVIGPRLNAMGRIEHAMDSLRFICTPNFPRAVELANKLHITNKERQQLTFESVENAKSILKTKNSKKLIFLASTEYNPGVIGLIAGRLTEEYYRPSIVISEGVDISKGSARSVKGFNIIEFIRKFSDLLVDKGGHPMAAGFTLKTKNLKKLKELMEENAEKEITDDLLIRNLNIDCVLPVTFLNLDLFNKLNELAPFGYVNPEPVFQANNLKIESLRFVGKDSKHLKLNFLENEVRISAILFGYDKNLDLKIGDRVNVAYNISLNEWNGDKKLELKLKDIIRFP